MAKKQPQPLVNIGFGGALFLIFMTLKLCGKIGWSWWWVTSPLWISFGFWLVLLLVILIVAAETGNL
jgi:hypothetical protein